MLQNIDGKSVYVVEFDTMPELPITGLTPEETVYDKLLHEGPVYTGRNRFARMLFNGEPSFVRKQITYADILTDAIETGQITEPGKYGLHKVPGTADYEIYTIVE